MGESFFGEGKDLKIIVIAKEDLEKSLCALM